MWAEARNAPACTLCRDRKQSISPYALKGKHDTCTQLSENIVEVVHRIKNDSGRLTKRWFDEQIEAGLSREEYIEILSLVATSIILDSYATAMGLPDYSIPSPQPGEPTKVLNPEVID